MAWYCMHVFWHERTCRESPSLHRAQGHRCFTKFTRGFRPLALYCGERILQEEERTSSEEGCDTFCPCSDNMPPYDALNWNVARAAPVTAGLPDIPSEVRTRQLFAVISTTVVLFFAILSYALRLWARKRSFQNLSIDDWLMGAGLLITLEPAICEYMCKKKRLFQTRFMELTRPIGSTK
jgi:hypothetical protein